MCCEPLRGPSRTIGSETAIPSRRAYIDSARCALKSIYAWAKRSVQNAVLRCVYVYVYQGCWLLLNIRYEVSTVDRCHGSIPLAWHVASALQCRRLNRSRWRGASSIRTRFAHAMLSRIKFDTALLQPSQQRRVHVIQCTDAVGNPFAC